MRALLLLMFNDTRSTPLAEAGSSTEVSESVSEYSTSTGVVMDDPELRLQKVKYYNVM